MNGRQQETVLDQSHTAARCGDTLYHYRDEEWRVFCCARLALVHPALQRGMATIYKPSMSSEWRGVCRQDRHLAPVTAQHRDGPILVLVNQRVDAPGRVHHPRGSIGAYKGRAMLQVAQRLFILFRSVRLRIMRDDPVPQLAQRTALLLARLVVDAKRLQAGDSLEPVPPYQSASPTVVRAGSSLGRCTQWK